jgi:hypothetical protein
VDPIGLHPPVYQFKKICKLTEDTNGSFNVSRDGRELFSPLASHTKDMQETGVVFRAINHVDVRETVNYLENHGTNG